MRANELMVGDWVKLDFYDNAYADIEDAVWKNGKITAIHHGNWVDVNFGGPLDECDIEVKDVQPIPLTPEILEKNGFEKCNEDTDGAIQYEWGSPALGIDIWINTKPYLLGAWRTWEGETVAYTMANELPINYVHELQHALRLCGIKKEITI